MLSASGTLPYVAGDTHKTVGLLDGVQPYRVGVVVGSSPSFLPVKDAKCVFLAQESLLDHACSHWRLLANGVADDGGNGGIDRGLGGHNKGFGELVELVGGGQLMLTQLRWIAEFGKETSGHL